MTKKLGRNVHFVNYGAVKYVSYVDGMAAGGTVLHTVRTVLHGAGMLDVLLVRAQHGNTNFYNNISLLSGKELGDQLLFHGGICMEQS